MINDSLISLEKEYCENSRLVGNKAANLSRLLRNGFNVANGIVLTINCVKNVIESDKNINIIINKINESISSPYIVRSSSMNEDSRNHSFAGVFDSVLNVSSENLKNAIIQVVNSKYNPFVKLYCNKHKLKLEDIQLSVLVQEMVETDIAGVGFSKNPIYPDENIIIEASNKPIENLVEGGLKPEQLIISPVSISDSIQKLRSENNINLKIVSNSDNFFRLLSKKRSLELAILIQNIEDLMGIPQDIEWASVNKKFVIFQTRPITSI